MEKFDTEVEERIAELRARPDLLLRYDVTGDGELDDAEWELIRRMVALELKTAEERNTTWDLDAEPEVFRDRYEVVGLLGRGGQAFTYLARDLDADGEHVVIKELAIQVAKDWKAIELFEREAEVLERLTHPRIPRYIDAFHLDADGAVRFMLVQDFVDGHDLGSVAADGKRWDEDEATRRMIEVAEILDYLHGKSPPLIHRDVKPSNLILGRDDNLYLVDFGAVQAIVPTTVGGSTIIGTTGYVPMEQYLGRASPESDLYALGATAIHMLTGKHPADLPYERGRLKFDAYLDVSDDLGELLGRLLDPVVEERPRSATKLMEALQRPTALEPPTDDGGHRRISSAYYEPKVEQPTEGKLVASSDGQTAVIVAMPPTSPVQVKIRNDKLVVQRQPNVLGPAMLIFLGFLITAAVYGATTHPVGGLVVLAMLPIASLGLASLAFVQLRTVLNIEGYTWATDDKKGLLQDLSDVHIRRDSIALRSKYGEVAIARMPELSMAERKSLETLLTRRLPPRTRVSTEG